MIHIAIESGVFDHSFLLKTKEIAALEPPPDSALKVGAMTITWHDCENATLAYQIDPPDMMGTIELTRIMEDNVALCEVLASRP